MVPAVMVRSFEHPSPDRGTRDEGAVAVLVATFCVLLFGLAAIVIDLGYARDLDRQAQNAADAAALAAAERLSRAPNPASPTAAEINQARGLAFQYLSANGWPELGNVAFDTSARTVRVTVVPRQSSSFFSGAIGRSAPEVGGRAAAAWGVPTSVDCVVCVLDYLSGQVGGISVAGGSLATRRMDFNNGQGQILVTGGGTIGYSDTWNGNGTLSPTPQVIPAFTDPWVAIAPPPPYPGPAVNGSGSCQPGNYQDVENCASFAPGIYIVTGDVQLTGQESLVADGVMFYLTCSQKVGNDVYPKACASGEDGADWDLAGKGKLRVTPLANPASPWNGFSFVVDRENVGQQKWTGNGDFTVQGRVYAANTTGGLSLRGNGTMTLQGPLVLGFLELKGNKNQLSVNGPNVSVGSAPPDPIRLIE